MIQKINLDFDKVISLLDEKLSGWLEEVVLLLPNTVIALIIIFLSYITASITDKFIQQLLRRSLQNKSLAGFIALMAKISILILGFILAINIMHLDKAVASILAGIGIAGVALGFALQDITANFLSGIGLVIQNTYPFKIGDMIETNGFIGIVEDINLRSTNLKSFQGQTIIIPNRKIYENPVTNFSFLGERRVDLEVGISYGENLENVEKIVLDTIKNLKDIEIKGEVEFFYKKFDSSSINFDIRFWVPFIKQTEYLTARHRAIIEIKKSFDQNGITIPFPIRTLDFGIKGGQKLNEVLALNENIK